VSFSIEKLSCTSLLQTLPQLRRIIVFCLHHQPKIWNIFLEEYIREVCDKASRSDWRGLRDDFRTLDWIEIINGLGLNFGIKKLEHFLAEHDLLSVHNFNKY
jgi:hypothetical protein